MRRKKDGLDYYHLGRTLSNQKCAKCEKYVPQLAAMMGDLYCSRKCHDEHRGITHPTLRSMMGGVEGDAGKSPI